MTPVLVKNIPMKSTTRYENYEKYILPHPERIKSHTELSI